MSTPDRPASPTAQERERKDAEDRKREEEEQAKLPYKWTQTLTEADVTVPIAASYKARDLIVEMKKTKLKVQIKGQDPIIDVRFLARQIRRCSVYQPQLTDINFLQGDLAHPIHVDDSTWTLETTPEGKEISIHLAKAAGSNWWAHIITSAPKIDTTKIQPENSKLSELDGETRGMVEKMMYDQEMKRQGKPTSEEAKKNELLQKFMKEHPEMVSYSFPSNHASVLLWGLS
jgi:CS domain